MIEKWKKVRICVFSLASRLSASPVLLERDSCLQKLTADLCLFWSRLNLSARPPLHARRGGEERLVQKLQAYSRVFKTKVTLNRLVSWKKSFFVCVFLDATKQAVRDLQIADSMAAGGGVYVRLSTDLVGSEMATTFYTHTVTPGVPFMRIARCGNISGRVSAGSRRRALFPHCEWYYMHVWPDLILFGILVHRFNLMARKGLITNPVKHRLKTNLQNLQVWHQ